MPGKPLVQGNWLRAHLGLVYVFLYGPILMLIVLSFNGSGMPTAWGGFTLEWYAELARNEALLSAGMNSVIVAVGSTLIATVIGTLLAIGLERTVRSVTLDAFVFLPMIIPDIV
ncbi:MAG: hypothetical protein KAJ53_06475, partial [Anaerolineales bacterium]|nr:hypothetical protein [Anaerolineales bacterium]